MAKRKLRISRYLAEFYPDDGPTRATIINWIKNGQLRGERVGNMWYVVVESEDSANNVLDLVSLLEKAA